MLPRLVFDESAETAIEIAKQCGMSRRAAHRIIFENVEAGIWERVWKRGRIRPVPAYRIKR